MFVPVLGVPRWNSMTVRVAWRAILSRSFYINYSLFFCISFIICGDGGANSSTHGATDNGALTTTDFGTYRGTHATADRATEYGTGVHGGCCPGNE
jgi:hypothetical protein